MSWNRSHLRLNHFPILAWLIVCLLALPSVGWAQTWVSADGRTVLRTDACDSAGPPGSCGGNAHRAYCDGKEVSFVSVMRCPKPSGITNEGKILCGKDQRRWSKKDVRAIRKWITAVLAGTASAPERFV